MEKTCGNCENFVREPFKQHAGACMASYRDAPIRAYLCVSDSFSCERPVSFRPLTDTLEQRYAQLEQVAKSMWHELKEVGCPGFRLGMLRGRLLELGVFVDD